MSDKHNTLAANKSHPLWGKVALKDFCKKCTVKNIDRRYNTVFTNSAIHGVIKQSDYFEKDVANSENTDSYYVVHPEDFIYNPRISENAPYGPIRTNETEEHGVVSPLYFVFRLVDKKIANYDYLKYYFASSSWHRYVYSIGNNGARSDRMNISDADFMTMPVALPPLNEQRRIAKILGCCDRVIALKKELIAEKKKQRKALMQKLLNPGSGFRLPGFSGEWKTVKLKEVCDINTSSLSENTNPDKSFYYLDLATVDKGKIVNEPAFVTFGNAPCRARRLFKKGDILFSTVRPYLCGFLFADFVTDDYVASTGFAILTPQIGNMIGKLLYHHLFSDNIILQTQNLLSGTNYPALNSYDVENLYINIPKDIKEQQAIADILSAADKEIDLLEQELAQQEQKKKSLMQLLLTGIVRA